MKRWTILRWYVIIKIKILLPKVAVTGSEDKSCLWTAEVNFIKFHIEVIHDKIVSLFARSRIPGPTSRSHQESDIRLSVYELKNTWSKFDQTYQNERVCHAQDIGSNTQGQGHSKGSKVIYGRYYQVKSVKGIWSYFVKSKAKWSSMSGARFRSPHAITVWLVVKLCHNEYFYTFEVHLNATEKSNKMRSMSCASLIPCPWSSH